ncbi:hypothetical protein D3C71_1838270 [compost metagenome]
MSCVLHLAVGDNLIINDGKVCIGDGKVGIGQSEAVCQGGLDSFLVQLSVPMVVLIFYFARIPIHLREMTFTGWYYKRQFTARIHITEQGFCNRCAAFHTWIIRHQNGRYR